MATELQFKIKNGQDVARYLVYFSKLKNKSLTKEVSIVNISGLGLYRKHKRCLDKLMVVQDKYKIDLVSYAKFFLSKFNLTDENVEKLAEVKTLMWYADELKIIAKHDFVYKQLMKSVDNVVDACLKLGYGSVKEYLRYLIGSGKLAQKYLSGEISQYWIAGIKNLKKIVWKMDPISRDTLKEIADSQDKIMSDAQDAFTHFKIARISIISYTNEKLYDKLGV